MSGTLLDLRGALIAGGLFGLSICIGSPAQAADDGYANVFSSVLGAVGIVKPDAPAEIEYRERPPLVIPPSIGALPKPASGGTKRTAAWPQDPDVLRRRKAAEEARAPNTMDPLLSNKGEMMSKDEAMKGRGQGEPVRPNECGNDGNAHNCLVVNPDVLKAEGEKFQAANPDKADTVVAGKEPDRVFLTQPPKGYMKATKAVKATTEAPDEKLDDSSPRYMQQQEARKHADD